MGALVLHGALAKHAISVDTHVHARGRSWRRTGVRELILSSELNRSGKLMTLHHHVLILQGRGGLCQGYAILQRVLSLPLWRH